MTPEYLRWALALPPIAGPGIDSLVSVYQGSSRDDQLAIRRALTNDPMLTDFAGLNGLLSWPEPAEDDVMEVVWVEASPISHLVFTTDGRRYARLGSGLLSFAEFKAIYGRSVTAHINSLAYDRVRRMQRALELLQLEQPYEVQVQLASDIGVMEKTMRVYDMAQPVEYATRHHMVCCAIDGESPT